jgi:diguanylate cyclase (GGDEF)-like protein
MPTRPNRLRAVQVATFIAYVNLGTAALILAAAEGGASAFWLPGGIALATLVRFDRMAWPAIPLAAFAAFFVATGDWLLAVALGAGNTIEAIFAASLIDRMAGGAAVFRSARNVFRFVAIALVTTAITATLATAVSSLTGSAWAGYSPVWTTWWLGNLAGLAVGTPLAILVTTTPFARPTWRDAPRVAEGAALFATVIGVGLIVFGGQLPWSVGYYPLDVLAIPVLLWAAFRFSQREVAIAIALFAGIAVWGTLQSVGPFARPSRTESIIMLQAFVAVIGFTGTALGAAIAEHRTAVAQLVALETTDSLTGLANYRRLIDVLRNEITRSRRTGRPIAVLFLDLKGLRAINDQYGHLVGSRALCRMADTIQKTCRAMDTAGRFGGDEFALVLPETNEVGGFALLARLSQRLAADTEQPPLTMTGGLAVFPRDGDSPTLLLRAADESLYKAKDAEAAAKRRAQAVEAQRKTGAAS